MEYRKLGNTGIEVSVISMGCEGFAGKSDEEVMSDFDYLMDKGVNFVDMYSPEPSLRKAIGNAFNGRRDKFVLQSHLCSVYIDGQYQRTRNLKLVKSGFEQMLREIGTDYIDVGMIHYVDSLKDWKRVNDNGILDYAKQLKAEGKIRVIGMSSHNPEVAIEAVKSGDISVLMFSINPCYDMQPAGEDVEKLWADESYEHKLKNQDSQRKELYELCESRGVGIDVMKAYGGGDILDEKMSPFGRAFTPVQCISYSLTRPAVSAVMLGCKTIKEWDEALAYVTSAEDERDYSAVMSGMDKFTFEGHCLYCGHCAPCPQGISVASVTKFLNLTIAQGMVPETVREHYKALPHHASECVECGACETRCPFMVKIIENMRNAKDVFGI